MSKAEDLIGELIFDRNSKQRITRAELMEKTGYGDRYIRTKIEIMRSKGCHIVSDNTAGYYWADSDTYNAFCDREHKRGVHTMKKKDWSNPKQVMA